MRITNYTALYSHLDWQYNNAMSGPYENLYLRSEDGETVAGLKDGRISGAYRPMVCVGSKKWQKFVINQLWKISNDIYYMDFLIDGQLCEVSKFLLSQGYKARPVYTQIIDLTKTQEHLHADLRKSYKSLVNKRENLLRGNINDFRILHEKIKGKTRSDITWEIQERMKQLGQAFCVLDGWPDTKAQVIFYLSGTKKCNQLTSKQWIEPSGPAYYASGTSVNGADSHAVIWESIMTCKAMGCKFVELGEQVYSIGVTPDYPLDLQGNPVTIKQTNISLFKSGFGGVTRTRLILEK